MAGTATRAAGARIRSRRWDARGPQQHVTGAAIYRKIGAAGEAVRGGVLPTRLRFGEGGPFSRPSSVSPSARTREAYEGRESAAGFSKLAEPGENGARRAVTRERSGASYSRQLSSSDYQRCMSVPTMIHVIF